ncbi:MAG: SET domain-containing protein [bacterium]|nr:SET domain-containing protein [bacterium]
MKAYKIECKLPQGVTIRFSVLNGWGLFATRAVKKDDIVYTGTFIAVQKEDFPKEIELVVEQNTYYLPSYNHITPFTDGRYAVYTFDSVMNHHCDPSTHDKAHQNDPFKYDVIAARKIEVGEELTCNYNTFKWINENPFDCSCGAPTCCGRVEGYSKLTQQQKDFLRDLMGTSALMRKE